MTTPRTHTDASTNVPQHTSRREFLAGTMTAAALAAVTPGAYAQPAAPHTPKSPRKALRMAHLTDTHVKPELGGAEGMAACLRHMFSLPEPPQLIITGGDLPMDTGSATEARSKLEWDLFKRVLADNLPKNFPIYHALGNHDIFGRNRKAGNATGNEPLFGKRWFMENFQYTKTYQAFTQANWKFIVLDSIDWDQNTGDYVIRIVGEQKDWLHHELASTPPTTPVLIVSHAPIMSVANFFDKDDAVWKTDGDTLNIYTERMHVDCRDLDALFLKHRNVKLCLSGHLHLVDRCVYNDVTYICDGAVSGAKWKGPKRQCNPGYGLVDLYDDGSFTHAYTEFGWVAKPE